MADQLSRKRSSTAASRAKSSRSYISPNRSSLPSDLNSVPPKKRFKSYQEPQPSTSQQPTTETQQLPEPRASTRESVIKKYNIKDTKEKPQRSYYLRSASSKDLSRLASSKGSSTAEAAITGPETGSGTGTATATTSTSTTTKTAAPKEKLSTSSTSSVTPPVRGFIRKRRNAIIDESPPESSASTSRTNPDPLIAPTTPLHRTSVVLRRSTRNKSKSTATESNINSKTTGNCKSRSSGPRDRTSNTLSGGEPIAARNAATVTTSHGRRANRVQNNNKVGVIATTSTMNDTDTDPYSMPLINDSTDPSASNAATVTDMVLTPLATAASTSTGGQLSTRGLVSTTETGLIPTGTGMESSSALLLDSESDDSDVGRLQAILESRGLPSHLLGALGPRVQHILHRTIGSNSITNKVNHILQCIQSGHDEIQQLQAVIEICQMLVMGNEDTLAGFPIKQTVPVLIRLLEADQNFDMMNHACRALTYMMESLPRSSHHITDAVPIFLQKLQVIQCMDVAEQSLTALDMLSKRHSKTILLARGVSACLMYIDFFSINAQRAALSIASNCCQNIRGDEFALVVDSLPLLANRLSNHDKRSVESICLLFSRLVENYQHDSKKLKEIISSELLANLQQLLVATPPLISTNIFNVVLRMLATICANSKQITMALLKQNISETLLFLLIGSPVPISDNIELVQHSPQELSEITTLIAELVPSLPSDGIFTVDSLLEKPSLAANNLSVIWQWRDERGIWNSYSAFDSKIIETAHMFGEEDISISFSGRIYIIDFPKMTQINEDTGTSRNIRRQLIPLSQPQQTQDPSSATSPASPPSLDESAKTSTSNDAEQSTTSIDLTNSSPNESSIFLNEDRELISGFIHSTFSVLYEVYSSSAGPEVRCMCLKALLRMIYFANADLLKEVMKSKVVSNHIAGMLASKDLRVVVRSLQMAQILMKKLPDVFGIHFHREGVFHQITKLSQTHISSGSANESKIGTIQNSSLGDAGAGTSRSMSSIDTLNESTTKQTSSSAISNLSQIRLTDVLKRKRPGKRTANSSSSSRSKAKHDEQSNTTPQPTSATALFQEMFQKSASNSGTQSHSSSVSQTPNKSNKNSSGSGSNNSSLLATFARWSRNNDRYFTNSPKDPMPASSSSLTSCFSSNRSPTYYHSSQLNVSNSSNNNATSMDNLNQNLSASNREKVKVWIRDQSKHFLELYVRPEGESSATGNILKRLKSAISKLRKNEGSSLDPLRELCKIFLEADVTPFEVNHAGFVKVILEYLTKSEQHLRNFLHVFCALPLHKDLFDFDLSSLKTAGFSALVAKLNACISQLEQFPVKVHDFAAINCNSASRGNTSALRFFNTHQLKCNLQRHPQCTNLKQWKGGTVKIDPLALVQAIERYLVLRGYSRIREKDVVESDDDSDDDLDDNLGTLPVSQSITKHKLQFLIGDRILPYNMTVYQAIHQYSASANPHLYHNSGHHHLNDQSETDTDIEIPLNSANIWAQTHLIYYRPFVNDNTSSSNASSSRQHTIINEPSTSTSSSSAKATTVSAPSTSGVQIASTPTKVSNLRSSIPILNAFQPTTSSTVASRKSKSSSKKIDLAWSEGIVPVSQSPLIPYLKLSLAEVIHVQDQSLEVMSLLRLLYGLNRHWFSLYYSPHENELLPFAEFLNSKITAKANRQLQDPLAIMTGNLPNWLTQIGNSCPFLFPFETRQLLFYVSSFDRDRALQRLLDSTPELNSSDSQDRVTPRLDRRKRTINRRDILKQAESIMQDMSNSKAMLEIQYDDEVGTGLGPTLEFYAIVSQELQKTTFDLWNRESVLNGALYPMPLGRYAKSTNLTKIRAKFRFLGKFMAKAVMDSRLVDIPLSRTFYKWILGQEFTMSLVDLTYVVPEVQKTLVRFQKLITMKENIESNSSLSDSDKLKEIEALHLDDCPIEDLGLEFVLPGYASIDLYRNSRNTAVTIHNVKKYCSLVIYWLLKDGVQKQMEAFREGFNSVFPISQLSFFYPEELDAVFCGNSYAWDIKMLTECLRPDHGYTFESKAIQFLLAILSQYHQKEQRLFLQFLTGTPRLPVGGFKALSPQLTVVRTTFDPNINPDDYLPSVMTCVNYLKLPDYSTIEVMRQKLQIAINEGQRSFYLS